ncbi:MAG: carboxymuconolactone decarboxylase family protein [Deltaproteobacteria bacterium]|nr:carboxymuconolactone decarboxylase family protein [Deltaproteobacteria bacterium]
MSSDRESVRRQLEVVIGPFPAEVRDLHLDSLIDGMPTAWLRSDIPQGLRSAVTLGVLTALGIETELAAHVRRALNQSGLSRLEVAEVLRHAAIYAGVPRANAALRIAKQVFDELDAGQTPSR